MKILNLDKLDTSGKRQLRIAGKDYPVLGMTVDNFIATTLEAEKLEKEQNLTPRHEVEAMINVILRSVPSAPRELLTNLQLEQLRAIGDFIRGEDVEGATEELAEDESPNA